MEPAKPRMSNSAVKVFKVLDVLTRNFFHGFSPTEISKETDFSLSAINGYVNTLVEAGYAERIQETGRIRPSTRYAKQAVQILHAMEAAQSQVSQIKSRLDHCITTK
jgi:DNA-binding IclR family transcriptional regulator